MQQLIMQKDMESNFKINEYRATMKFMEMFSDYYNFNLKSLINDIWNFDVKDLLTFKKRNDLLRKLHH